MELIDAFGSGKAHYRILVEKNALRLQPAPPDSVEIGSNRLPKPLHPHQPSMKSFVTRPMSSHLLRADL